VSARIDETMDANDLADASIVVMSELHPKSQVVTVDRSDFSLYRRNDRQVISFIAHSPR
jgi:hypothetical protein